MSTISKIYFVIPNSEIGGAQNFSKRLFNNIEIDSKFFYVEDLVSYGKLNFFYRVFNLYKLTKSQTNSVAVYATVNSVIPSVVCRMLFRNFLLISRIGNTISAEIKSNFFDFYKNLLIYKVVFRFSDYVVLQSESMKKDLLTLFQTNDRQKFIVINNGIDFKEIEKKSLEENKININSQYVNFILVGSFKYQKAYDVFINALKLISKDDLSQMRFYICGGNASNGSGFNAFKEQAIRLSLDKYINLLGWVENPFPLMKNMNGFILPSRYEGFPNALIEALSFGLPSIVSRSPGANQEIITDGFNGISFKNEDADDLAKKILQIRDTLKTFNSDEIIRDVKTRFDMKKVANEYKKLIAKETANE